MLDQQASGKTSNVEYFMEFDLLTLIFRLLEGLIPEDILDVQNRADRNPFPANMADDIIPLVYSIDIDVLPQLPPDENAQEENQNRGEL